MSTRREHALSPGQLLDEYRIESVLGAGGFGVTYLATDAKLGVKVAIKEYLPRALAVRKDGAVAPASGEASAEFYKGLDRFMAESRTIASFHHPNIVRVLRLFEANETAYMVMEHVEGEPLSTWAPPLFPLEESVIRPLLLHVLDGLEVVHAASYLHRDIKPANVLVRASGEPVLIDFGAARLVRDDASELTSLVSPGYTPLEQYHSTGYQGPWSDLYALGGVLYWLVTGTSPLDAPARVLGTPMTPAVSSSEARRYTGDFLALIDWMLDPLRNKRPQSIGEVRSALGIAPAGLLEHRSGAHTMPATPTAPPARASSTEIDGARRKKIEAELARALGPLAKVVVKRAAKKAASEDDLIARVAKEIDDAAARSAFLLAVGARGEDAGPSRG